MDRSSPKTVRWGVRILGTGSFLPAQRVTATDLDARLNVAPGTCLERNGVAERYFAHEGETASVMASAAVAEALVAAGLVAADLDAILFSGVMSEQPMPCTAILIHRRLGGRQDGVTCFDINASCTGFLKGFEIAAAGISAGSWRHVAVVAAEIASKGLRWDDLDTCTLFGDGAAAAVLGPAAPGEDSEVRAVHSATLSDGAELSTMRAGGSRYNVRTPPPRADDYLFAMHGRGLLRRIQGCFPQFLATLLRAAPDLALVVPHQASAVGLGLLRRQLAERPGPALPYVDILSTTGNQVSASLPTALHRAIADGRLRRGDSALLIGTGAGLAMSGIVLRH